MNIALIAHDKKKSEMLDFATAYKHTLKRHNLFATGTTGSQLIQTTGLDITCFLSGPIGGDQQIGAKIAENQMDLIIFFRDPLTAQPHEPDVSALMRLADVHYIPIATNLAAAEIFLSGLERGDFKWREVVKDQIKEK